MGDANISWSRRCSRIAIACLWAWVSSSSRPRASWSARSSPTTCWAAEWDVCLWCVACRGRVWSPSGACGFIEKPGEMVVSHN